MSNSNNQFLGTSFNFNANGNTWRVTSLPSLMQLSNIDIFATANEQFRPDENLKNENKLYSPFNDYFGLVNIIKGNTGMQIGDKEQVHPIASDAFIMEHNLMKLKNTWQSNSLHNNLKQFSEREQGHYNGPQTMKLGYGETLSNAIWNNNITDTDSSTHTSPLTPSQTFTSFPPPPSMNETDLRMAVGTSASVQHHIVSMLQAEAKLKAHTRVHTGSIGDEDSLSDGSSNGIGSGRGGLMSSAVSAALANGLPNISDGTEDNKYQRHRRVKLCVFCRNNGKSEEHYKGHVLKDSSGRVVCPILRAYVCPTCGESGDNAHTLKYCPATQPTLIYSPGVPDNGMQW